jgi:predicted GNAT family N-acyltransferase
LSRSIRSATRSRTSNAESRASTGGSCPTPIGRLAVDKSRQGRGLGRDLLRDALRRTLAAADQIGIRAVLVDAVDDNVAAFYRRHGFEPMTTDGLTLMVPLAVRTQLVRWSFLSRRAPARAGQPRSCRPKIFEVLR